MSVRPKRGPPRLRTRSRPRPAITPQARSSAPDAVLLKFTEAPLSQSGVFFSWTGLRHISGMSDRVIRWAIQAGLVLVVIVALPYKVFELARYFVPKELVLPGAALLVAGMLGARRHYPTSQLVD